MCLVSAFLPYVFRWENHVEALPSLFRPFHGKEWPTLWIKECSYWPPGQSIICQVVHCFFRSNSPLRVFHIGLGGLFACSLLNFTEDWLWKMDCNFFELFVKGYLFVGVCFWLPLNMLFCICLPVFLWITSTIISATCMWNEAKRCKCQTDVVKRNQYTQKLARYILLINRYA